MSRIGKKPIEIKEGVEVKIEQDEVKIKGPKGELFRKVPPEIKIELKDYYPPSTLPAKGGAPRKILVVSPKVKTKRTKALWGLIRTLISNMVEGVTEGFQKKLQLEGIGFRVSMEGENLILKVGFTHSVKMEPPENVKFSVEKNIITVSGIDKEKVSQVAAKIRKVRPPDPYKGKGIRYLGEIIKKKVGKRATGI